MKTRKHIVIEMALVQALEKEMDKKGVNFSEIVSEVIEAQVDGVAVRGMTEDLLKRFVDLQTEISKQLVDMRMQLVSMQKWTEEETKRQIASAVEDIKSDSLVLKQEIYDSVKEEVGTAVQRHIKIATRNFELTQAKLDSLAGGGITHHEVEKITNPRRDGGGIGGNSNLSISPNK